MFGVLLDKKQLEKYMEKLASDQIIQENSDERTYPIENLEKAFNYITMVYNLLNEHIKLGIDIHPAGEWLLDNYYIIDNLNQAMTKVGIKAQATPIRGGTDGARLTFMGLPCPNIGTGGANFHGPFEFVSLTMMKQAVEVLKELIKE